MLTLTFSSHFANVNMIDGPIPLTEAEFIITHPAPHTHSNNPQHTINQITIPWQHQHLSICGG